MMNMKLINLDSMAMLKIISTQDLQFKQIQEVRRYLGITFPCQATREISYKVEMEAFAISNNIVTTTS